MEFRHVKAGVILGSVVAVAAIGCATARPTAIGSGDPVADRQRLMKNNGANWADIQNKVKAGNVEGVAVNAEALALHAQRITLLFPEGGVPGRSEEPRKPGRHTSRSGGREGRGGRADHRHHVRPRRLRDVPHAIPRAATPATAGAAALLKEAR